MLRNLLKRFGKRRDEQAVEHAIAHEQMSPDERRRVGGRLDDLKADRLAELQNQTGKSLEHLEDDSEAPRP